MQTVALVGRPNVGKSTLFNRLVGKSLALVDDQPGVTRDWRIAEGRIGPLRFRLLDTAGMEDAHTDPKGLPARMRKSTQAAIDQADVIVFMIDGRAGVTPLDQSLANELRKTSKPVILVVNKCEGRAGWEGLSESYGLGLGEPVTLSSAHGEGLGELYDCLEPYIEEEAEDEEETAEEDKPIRMAVLGRPNVGKSTLVNALLGEERMLTGPEAGITRDALSIPWHWEGRFYKIVDTAGLRRKARVEEKLEKMAGHESFRAVRLAQVVVLLLDAQEPLTHQDVTLANHVIAEGRVLVIALNKTDAVKGHDKLVKELRARMKDSLAEAPDVPVVPISALKGKGLDKLMQAVERGMALWQKRVTTGKLNRWLEKIESQNPAPLSQGRPNRLRYISQINTNPPTFALWVSRPDTLPDHYRRYVINALRRDFGFEGIPVRLLIRTSQNPYAERK